MTASMWVAFFVICIFLCIMLELITTPAIPRAAETRKKRWPTNIALHAINIGLSALIPVSAVAVAQYAEQHSIGLLHWLQAPGWVEITVTVLVASLSSYVLHRLNHEIPLLWRIHRVHHTDNDLDWSSALRNHPAEVVLSILFHCAAALMIGATPAALLAMLLLNWGIDLFSHSRFALPPRLERVMQWVIVTPQLHHIHHSSWQPETDSNYGGDFSIWDRLFGTLNRTPLRPLDTFAYGIDTVDPALAHDLDWLLISPTVPDSIEWAETAEHARTYRP